MSPTARPVVVGATQVLAHVPGMARHGSKPRRELPRDPAVEESFLASLRSFDDAAAYVPHQAYLNTIHPRDMPDRPWVGPERPVTAESTGRRADQRADGQTLRWGPAGEIMPEDEFLGLMAAVDEFELIKVTPDTADRAAAGLAAHRLGKHFDLDRVDKARGDPEALAADPLGLPLSIGAGNLAAAVRGAQADDEALSAHVLLENPAGKATASLALLHLLEDTGVDPLSIDFVIGCGEEAIGDRYQRGGGNLAKAVAGVTGLGQASGMDVKNFCAAPVPALVVASSLVASGVFQRVAVVAGGSLAKLGMKFQGHLKNGLPVLEDVLGGAAALVQADDGVSPQVRLDGVGRHTVAAGGSNPQIIDALTIQPLAGLGLTTTDVDDFATELHNPEITEPQGSGNVPERNYRTLAALAARRGDIDRDQIDEFVTSRGMPGFAPTQGHLASALCYLPHAIGRLTAGEAGRVMLIAKGSLFLGRMCPLSDGMSVILERNPGA